MRTSLRVALVGGPMYDPLYERIPEFERSSGVAVEVVVRLPHPQLNERMERDFGAGADPGYDLISTHTKYAPSQREFLLPLDGLLDPAELGGFSPAMLEHARIGGALYAVPRNLDVKLLYYRTDLFEEAGLQVPETWDALAAAAARLTRPPERYGFVFPGRCSGLFGHFFELDAMAGGDLFGAGLELRFSDEAGRWALGFLAGLYRRGVVPPELPGWHYDEVTRFFLEGRAAMTTDWPGGYHLFNDRARSRVWDRFDVAIYPVGPSGKRRVYCGGHTFAIPRSVHDRGAAVRLLRFLTSEESQYAEARHGSIPVRPSVARRIGAEAEQGSRDDRRLELLARTVESSMLMPPKFAEYPAVEDALWTSLQAAIVGEVSIEAALERAEEQTRAIVGRS